MLDQNFLNKTVKRINQLLPILLKLYDITYDVCFLSSQTLYFICQKLSLIIFFLDWFCQHFSIIPQINISFNFPLNVISLLPEFSEFSIPTIWCIILHLPIFYFIENIFIKICKFLSETKFIQILDLNVIVNDIYKFFGFDCQVQLECVKLTIQFFQQESKNMVPPLHLYDMYLSSFLLEPSLPAHQINCQHDLLSHSNNTIRHWNLPFPKQYSKIQYLYSRIPIGWLGNLQFLHFHQKLNMSNFF